MDDEVIYDALGPITAYRCWGFGGNFTRLTSLANSRAWEPGTNGAIHDLSVNGGMSGVSVALGGAVYANHHAPVSGCTCGFWGVKDIRTLVQFLSYGPSVIGEVEMWGRVIEHQYGYRAEYAKVKRLYVVSREAIVPPTAEVLKRYEAEMVTEDPAIDAFMEADPVTVDNWFSHSGIIVGPSNTLTWNTNTQPQQLPSNITSGITGTWTTNVPMTWTMSGTTTTVTYTDEEEEAAS